MYDIVVHLNARKKKINTSSLLTDVTQEGFRSIVSVIENNTPPANRNRDFLDQNFRMKSYENVSAHRVK